MRAHTLRMLMASSLLLGLAACEHFPKFAQAPRVRAIPVDMPANGDDSAEDRLYARAAQAIDQRQYDSALEALQIAKAARPGDPRVLNALAVVYDKLGRFDLSGRYYELAEKADPGSKIVAMNRRYSQILQHGAAQVGSDGVALAANLVGAPASAAPSSPAPSSPAPPSPAPPSPDVAPPRPAPTLAHLAGPASRGPPEVSEDELYRRAVVFIQRRDFGDALGELRAGLQTAPHDARVLSAMGVVYDWLGRFDLSAHYYDLAEAADPGSRVVAANRRYSRILQMHGGAMVAPQVLMAADASRRSVPVIAMRPAPVRTALRETGRAAREGHTG